MQIAVELSATATVLKNEGFAGVTRPPDLPATDAAAKALWEAGKIRTISFEMIKPKAAKYLGDEAFWLNVDFLQRTRNKLVHFHAPIMEGDRFDLNMMPCMSCCRSSRRFRRQRNMSSRSAR